jgi:hypothetical protein
VGATEVLAQIEPNRRERDGHARFLTRVHLTLADTGLTHIENMSYIVASRIGPVGFDHVCSHSQLFDRFEIIASEHGIAAKTSGCVGSLHE